ncbi:MAG: flippase [Candidatus Pacebacteria bacterium]|nr:flippase [Candidatus Paceibacterota bacterium]
MTWLSASEAVTRLLTAILGIFIARKLGAENFGVFTFATSLTGMFAVLADFGLRSIVVRELNQKEEARSELGTVLWLRIILGIVTFFLIFIFSFFIENDIAKIITIIFGAVILVSNIHTFYISVFQATQKMEYISITEILKTLFIVTGGFLILFMKPNIILIAYLYLSASVLSSIVSFFIARRLSFGSLLNFDKKIAKKYLTMSLPLVLSSAFSAIYVQTDSVMMGFWNMIKEVGWYQAAYRVVNITVVPAIVIGIVFYPIIANAYKKKENFQKIVDLFFLLLVSVALPIAVGGFLLAKDIIIFLYSDEYLPSVLAFKMLTLTSSFIMLSLFINYLLITTGRQKDFSFITGLTALLNVFLNLVLIPRYSLYGAAGATLISYTLLLLLGFFYLDRINVLPNFKIISLPLLAALTMAAFLSWKFSYDISIIPRILIGGFIYCFVFLIILILKDKLSPVKITI